MRFRLIECMIIFSIVGFAGISLKRSDALFETVFFSFTLGFVLASMLLAVARKCAARAFWTGFAVSALSYLVFAHVPDVDGVVPRHDGPEITTQLLRHGLNWMHAESYGTNFVSQPGGYFSVDDSFAVVADDRALPATRDGMHNETDSPFSAKLSLLYGGGQRIVADGRSVSFMRIGHSVWALLLGWIGGHFTQMVYERSNFDRTNQ